MISSRGVTLALPERLLAASDEMTDSGDKWREFAVIGARICKGRASESDTYRAMADILRTCADREAALYRELSVIVS